MRSGDSCFARPGSRLRPKPALRTVFAFQVTIPVAAGRDRPGSSPQKRLAARKPRPHAPASLSPVADPALFLSGSAYALTFLRHNHLCDRPLLLAPSQAMAGLGRGRRSFLPFPQAPSGVSPIFPSARKALRALLHSSARKNRRRGRRPRVGDTPPQKRLAPSPPPGSPPGKGARHGRPPNIKGQISNSQELPHVSHRFFLLRRFHQDL
ncbi:hypothetical protein Bind_3712 (plasmid) [Beijerinckia indica subsp. indica ATCC 9039]|uniref:Uncharacterized protein n=1 Tax=Beijerinckia indica subsp. indica (strain ATCC 9039 / DSM 1715 / NCIMB 8712) TaxID=395963 RepID=B2IL64_BEII9|nr:hypothetical protein Bind_3712 [Beijerinckia indica subsp. indica ATCC 9039]